MWDRVFTPSYSKRVKFWFPLVPITYIRSRRIDDFDKLRYNNKQVSTKCYTQTHVFRKIRYLNELTKTLFRLFLSLSLDTQKLTLLLHEFRWHVLNLF